jgi:hypothetical protein
VRELSRYLFLGGALPFLLLGGAHALHTPRKPSDRKGLSPWDPTMAESMARTRVLLTGRTDMWGGWVGFNLRVRKWTCHHHDGGLRDLRAELLVLDDGFLRASSIAAASPSTPSRIWRAS